MVRLLRVICLFRGHEPVPFCGPSHFYTYFRCRRCHKLTSRFRDDIKIEWEPDDVWAVEEPWNQPQEPQW